MIIIKDNTKDGYPQLRIFFPNHYGVCVSDSQAGIEVAVLAGTPELWGPTSETDIQDDPQIVQSKIEIEKIISKVSTLPDHPRKGWVYH